MKVEIKQDRNALAFTICCAVAALAAIFFRAFNGENSPWLLSDEYTYAEQAKALWLHKASDAAVPLTGNWLYLLLMSISFAPAANFLVIAKILNTLSVASAGAAFFLVFRKVGGDLLAGISAVILAVFFIGGYAKLFMPEAMQFAATVVIACTFFEFGLHPSMRRSAALGVVAGVGAQIKVHLLLLSPCLLIGIALIAFTQRMNWRQFMKLSTVFIITLLLTTYLIRLAISGRTDLRLFGDFYGGIAEQGTARWLLVPMYWHVFVRHIETIFLAFSSDVAIVVVALLGLRRNNSAINIVRCTLITLILGLMGMLLVTTVFTVSVAGVGPHESLDRIHGRYYEHFMILTAAVACLCAADFMRDTKSAIRWAVFTLTGFCLVLSFIKTSEIGWQNPMDYMSTFGLFSVPNARLDVLVLGVCTLIVLAILPSYANWTGTLALGAMLFFSAYQLERLSLDRSIGDVDKAAMIIAAEALGTHDKVMVVSNRADTEIYRAGFHLLEQETTLSIKPDLITSRATCAINARTAEWLLVIAPGGYQHCDGLEKLVQLDGVVAYHVANSPAHL